MHFSGKRIITILLHTLISFAAFAHSTVFSLWDTYRNFHPLLTLVFPKRQIEMVQSMLDMYKENGWLPKWKLQGNETYVMVGDPASIVIADTY